MNLNSFSTSFPVIDNLITNFTKDILKILKNNVVGIYLFGSLTYNDFVLGRSDIDLIVITKKICSTKNLKKLFKIHKKIENNYKRWKKRIEVSYIPISMLSNILPPKTPRPYCGEGKFYKKAKFGNEWIINLYLLYNHGIAIYGPKITKIIKEIKINDVKKACIKDLYQEWKPKLKNSKWLYKSHYQSYLVLNLCRIIYTIKIGKVASKTESARWVKKQYSKWIQLIKTSENWIYGKRMNNQKQVADFLNFIIAEVSI